MPAKKKHEQAKSSPYMLNVTRDQLPASLEAERAVLGSIMSDNAAFMEASLMVRSDDFSVPAHQYIYRAMLDLFGDSRTIDLITISENLSETKHLTSVGGTAYLSELSDYASAHNIKHYCEIVREKSMLRQVINVANTAVAEAMEQADGATKVIGRLNSRILDVITHTTHVEVHKVSDWIDQQFDRLRTLAKGPKQGALGLTLSIPKLDRLTSGMQRTEQIVIASYSSEGKSLLLKSILFANLVNGIKSLVMTPEMTKEQYLMRMIPEATDGHFPASLLRDPRNLEPTYRAQLEIAYDKLKDFPLWVVDVSSLTTAQMSAIMRAMVRKEGIRITALDYVQLIAPDGEENDYVRITRAAEATRTIAKEEQINNILVSQVTWPKEKGKKPPPNLGMLRGSGDIGQGAHIILMPYRPESTSGYVTGKDQIRIAKMREGSRAPVLVEIDRARGKFVERFDADEKDEDDNE